MEDIPEQKAQQTQPKAVQVVRLRYFDLDQFFLAMETTGPITFRERIQNNGTIFVQAFKVNAFNYSTYDDLVPLEANEPVQFSHFFDQTNPSPTTLLFNSENFSSYPSSFENILKGKPFGWLVFNIITSSHTNQLGDVINGEMTYNRHFFGIIYHPAQGQIAVPFKAFCNSASIQVKNNNSLQQFSNFNAGWDRINAPSPPKEQ